jgi:hypothetical protein
MDLASESTLLIGNKIGKLGLEIFNIGPFFIDSSEVKQYESGKIKMDEKLVKTEKQE